MRCFSPLRRLRRRSPCSFLLPFSSPAFTPRIRIHHYISPRRREKETRAPAPPSPMISRAPSVLRPLLAVPLCHSLKYLRSFLTSSFERLIVV